MYLNIVVYVIKDAITNNKYNSILKQVIRHFNLQF